MIQRVIDESDYYLLAIGGRYGSSDADGLGFTEKEFDYAVSRGKPVMAFLHKSPEKLPFENSEGDPKARAKLQKFRAKLEHSKHVKFWSSAEDLAGKVALSFGSFVASYPAGGWVRGDAGDSPETLAKWAAAQDRIAALEARLELEATQPPPGVEGLASGDESLQLSCQIKMVISNLASGVKWSDKQEVPYLGKITWNELLYALGPLMLDEAQQRELRTRFLAEVVRVNTDEARAEADRWIRRAFKAVEFRDHVPGRRRPDPEFEVTLVPSTDDFETALMQLQALGLIERGSKKRPVADSQTYWALTPWGRTRLTQLRAVRAGEVGPPESLQ